MNTNFHELSASEMQEINGGLPFVLGVLAAAGIVLGTGVVVAGAVVIVGKVAQKISDWIG
ncbi:bacteriocin [Clostridium thermarum]|uniref:bacteriocin n=1 Tax=Clostridium thermarum TaxID=1716543 RepID=UPI0011226918|nr:bacteriocin [Clostridium thermarum]